VVLHLTRTVNKCLAYLAEDTDGPKVEDIVFILTKLRRSMSVLQAFNAKTDHAKIQTNVRTLLVYLDAITKRLAS